MGDETNEQVPNSTQEACGVKARYISFVSMVNADDAVKKEWEHSVGIISKEWLSLLNERAYNSQERRGNVSAMLQAAFALVPKEWIMSNERDVGRYFLMFCNCLGLSSVIGRGLDWESPKGAFAEIPTDGDRLVFKFTYGSSAADALRECESWQFPCCYEGANAIHLFGVNYNSRKHNIDRPLAETYDSCHVPNCVDLGPYEYAWYPTRDECGRGEDVGPMDAEKARAWLQQIRGREECERSKREEERKRKENEYFQSLSQRVLSRAESEDSTEASDQQTEEAFDDLLERVRQMRQNDSARGRRYASDEPPAIVKAVLTVILWLLVFFIIKACMR